MNSIRLFIPGRLCILGEHSDWAATYEYEKGYAIATTIDKGIYATCSKDDKFIYSYNNDKIECETKAEELNKISREKEYYIYVCSSVKEIIKRYDVKGINLTITKQNLPEKKGLSSSAAICTLVIRAFNILYDLGLSEDKEMELAYISERNAKSKCGKLDQIVALNNSPIIMTFDKENISYEHLDVGKDIYLVLTDLNGKKNTKKILNDLNKAYSDNQNIYSKDIRKYLGEINKQIIDDAKIALEEGNTKKLGKLMNQSQELFDKYLMPVSSEELLSPKLHELLSSPIVKKYTYGGKGVGSHGDGSAQFIAKDLKTQDKLIKYLKKEYGLNSYKITIKENRSIKKAIIPLAGNGTRMYPFTKNIPKAFIPIYKDGFIKPIFLILLEELNAAKIEKIALVINPKQIKMFKDFFTKDTTKELKGIYKKITFIIQEKQLGLSDALKSCRSFVKNDNVLLVLGDQFYKANGKINCTEQLLKQYNKRKITTISVCKTCIDEVENYGIFYGKLKPKEKSFIIDNITEKPTKEYAQKNLSINNNYYAAFGEYILSNELYNKICNVEDSKINQKGEYPFTEIINDYVKEKESLAFIPNGKMYDVGNPTSYLEATTAFKRKENKR